MFIRIELTSGLSEWMQIAAFSIEAGVLTLCEWSHTAEPWEPDGAISKGFTSPAPHHYTIAMQQVVKLEARPQDD